MTRRGRKPIFLLADSQLLFWRGGARSVMHRVHGALDVPPSAAKVAYLGAANGDAPELFELFAAAMAAAGISDTRQIPAGGAPTEAFFLEEADLIALGGGDVEVGWSALQRAGLVERVRERVDRGAILIGVGAGAVHAGLAGRDASGKPMKLLSLVPYTIDVHGDPAWSDLAALVQYAGGNACGIGIPIGGGLVAHPDGSIEPIRRELTEVVLRNGCVTTTEVFATDAAERCTNQKLK